MRALESARERVRERRRETAASQEDVVEVEPPRPANVEGIVELARQAPAHGSEAGASEAPRLVVHVDAAALAGSDGRAELEDGPLVSPETARRLGCDAVSVACVERDGLPLSVGRKRRTVPPKLRRLLEARDDGRCRWPGCERSRYLDAHHRTHWAEGGETSLDNLVLLCSHHHRFVHEGGYTIEDGTAGELRFRNRHGLLCPSVPRSPPAGSAEALGRANEAVGLRIDGGTSRNGDGDRLDLALAVAALEALVPSPG